jgi:hypothetical protein
VSAVLSRALWLVARIALWAWLLEWCLSTQRWWMVALFVSAVWCEVYDLKRKAGAL